MERSGIQGPYLNIVKVMQANQCINFKLSGEKLQIIPLKSGNRQCCPLSPDLFNIVLEILAREIRQQGCQRDTNWKGRNQTITVCRLNDSISKQTQKLNQRTPISDKQPQQSVQI